MKYETFPVGELESNSYLVYSEVSPSAVVIDAGGGCDTLIKRAKELNKKIEAVLLTHGHFDHTLAVADYIEAGVNIGISKKDEYMLSSHRDNLARYMGIVWNDVSADFTFSGGDKLEFGDLVFEVISTPGHTAGSCCFMCDNVCFSGDTLFLESVGRTDFPTGSHTEIVYSIRKKLLTLPEDTVVCPGHNEQTTIGHEKIFNPYVAEGI